MYFIQNRGLQNSGYYNPLPLKLSTVLDASYTVYILLLTAALQKFSKQVWIFLPRLIFQLPSCIFRTEGPPLDLYLSDGHILKHYDLLVQDADWLHLETSLGFYLNHMPINNVVRVMHIFL